MFCADYDVVGSVASMRYLWCASKTHWVLGKRDERVNRL